MCIRDRTSVTLLNEYTDVRAGEVNTIFGSSILTTNGFFHEGMTYQEKQSLGSTQSGSVSYTHLTLPTSDLV